MNMRNVPDSTKRVIVVALVFAAALAIYAWRERSPLARHEEIAQAKASAQVAHATSESSVDAGTVRSARAPAEGRVTSPTGRTFADIDAKAESNLEFIRRIHADAQSGDAEAQYQLFSALKYCERLYSFYFVRGKHRKTLDEALAWATQSPGTSVEEAREVHRRCEDLMENHTNEFGRADGWLAAAVEGGHPEAQLVQAEQVLVASALPLHGDARAAKENVDQDDVTKAKDFLWQGLKRKDPSAVWKIGDLQIALHGDVEATDKDQWVWRLAACKLGYHCSQAADWYQFMCRFDYNCQPHESGVDLILRASAATYPDVDLLSDRLVEKINKGDLSGLEWE